MNDIVPPNRYDEKTENLLRRLQDSYPFLDFFFKDIRPFTIDVMKSTRNSVFVFAMACLILLLVIVIMTIYSVLTFEEDPNKSFVENVGYLYYYTLVIAYSLPVSYFLVTFLNVSWTYFKFN
ncbi:Uncharacterized protein QTN25_008975 [Entamoeba marina]